MASSTWCFKWHDNGRDILINQDYFSSSEKQYLIGMFEDLFDKGPIGVCKYCGVVDYKANLEVNYIHVDQRDCVMNQFQEYLKTEGSIIIKCKKWLPFCIWGNEWHQLYREFSCVDSEMAIPYEPRMYLFRAFQEVLNNDLKLN